jgi:hypothetical protein
MEPAAAGTAGEILLKAAVFFATEIRSEQTTLVLIGAEKTHRAVPHVGSRAGRFTRGRLRLAAARGIDA